MQTLMIESFSGFIILQLHYHYRFHGVLLVTKMRKKMIQTMKMPHMIVTKPHHLHS